MKRSTACSKSRFQSKSNITQGEIDQSVLRFKAAATWLATARIHRYWDPFLEYEVPIC
jgi:hypothetical protein